jgi:hypothetical protein
MEKEKLTSQDKPIWKQSPSTRRDLKKVTAWTKWKIKILKYSLPFLPITLVNTEIQAQISKPDLFFYEQKNYDLPNTSLTFQNII